MAGEEKRVIPDMDTGNLYREETFTDNQVGSIRRMTPVNKDGSDDAGRPVLYVGQANLMTPGGALPINFEIPAESLEDAIARFSEEAGKAVEDTVQRLKEMQREAASQIVVPEAGTDGKIQVP